MPTEPDRTAEGGIDGAPWGSGAEALPAGRCDLHCHLLFGVDDGAKSPEESVEMARALVDLGYSVVAPSPHARAQYAPWKIAKDRLLETQRVIDDSGVPLRLFPNAENFILEDGFFDEQPGPSRRPLGKGPYVLVEAPYQAPVPLLREMVFRLTLRGIQPLFAHPERCQEFTRPGRARELVEAGALLQLDLGSLLGKFGVGARRLATSFVQDGLYAVAATDLHSPRDAREWVGAALRELERLVGSEQATRLTDLHPKRLLSGLAP
jgi:protein-tyrosine phosphatase